MPPATPTSSTRKLPARPAAERLPLTGGAKAAVFVAAPAGCAGFAGPPRLGGRRRRRNPRPMDIRLKPPRPRAACGRFDSEVEGLAPGSGQPRGVRHRVGRAEPAILDGQRAQGRSQSCAGAVPPGPGPPRCAAKWRQSQRPRYRSLPACQERP